MTVVQIDYSKVLPLLDIVPRDRRDSAPKRVSAWFAWNSALEDRVNFGSLDEHLRCIRQLWTLGKWLCHSLWELRLTYWLLSIYIFGQGISADIWLRDYRKDVQARNQHQVHSCTYSELLWIASAWWARSSSTRNSHRIHETSKHRILVSLHVWYNG